MLHCQTLPPRGPARGAAILLHGFGADEQDLLTLGLSLPRDLLYVALRAPLQLPWGGHAWYPLEATGSRGPAFEAEAEAQAVAQVVEFLQAVPQRWGIAPTATVLCGFSQGAAVTAATLLRADAPPLAGHAVLSGYVPAAASPPPGGLAGRAVFLGHGTEDQRVPAAAGRALRALLQAAGAAVTYREYALGHGIDEQEAADLAAWMEAVLPARA